jgi:hypothetical protein
LTPLVLVGVAILATDTWRQTVEGFEQERLFRVIVATRPFTASSERLLFIFIAREHVVFDWV